MENDYEREDDEDHEIVIAPDEDRPADEVARDNAEAVEAANREEERN